MFRHLPDGGRSRSRTPGIAHGAVLGADMVEHPLQKGVDEEPGTHIAWLFLTPHHLCLLKTRKFGNQRFCREWVKLLETQNIDVIDTALLALIIEIVIDIARADHDAADLVVGDKLDLTIRQLYRVIPKQSMKRSVVR